MNDAEIIKALECCSKPYCNNNNCPLHRNTINTKDCITQLSTNALDLINRQKAEVERLKSILLCFMDEVDKWENKHCLDISELPLIPIKGETEKIKKQIKAEAIKEFAERLKEELNNVARVNVDDFDYFVISLGFIDNLVKEMVGDSE